MAGSMTNPVLETVCGAAWAPRSAGLDDARSALVTTVAGGMAAPARPGNLARTAGL